MTLRVDPQRVASEVNDGLPEPIEDGVSVAAWVNANPDRLSELLEAAIAAELVEGA